MRVQFATLGKTPETVTNAIMLVPMDELHIFTEDVESPEVVEVMNQLDGKPLNIPVYTHRIDIFDLMDCLLVIIREIRKVQMEYEKKDPNLEITLNMTGGTNPMVASVLLAGYMTGGKVFYIKKHRDERGRGELIWIPMPRVSANDLRTTKLDIVKALGSFDEMVSLTKISRAAGLNSVQALNNHIPFFEKENLIEVKRKGKEKLVKLSPSGKVLYALMDYE